MACTTSHLHPPASPSPLSFSALSLSLSVFTCPFWSVLRADQMADMLMVAVLSNGAGWEPDTVPPPITTVTSSPTGCTLGNVPPAYRRLFDGSTSKVTGEHDPWAFYTTS